MNSQASSSSTLAKDSASSLVQLQNNHRVVVPGFRFRPTEQELILYYLGRKTFGVPLYTSFVPDIDVYKFEPHELPGRVGGDLEWYFFSKLDKKYDTGVRVNRSTQGGYWKVTGPEHKIKYGSQVIGEKRFLVYYSRHSKMGRRTDWVMHEFRLMEEALKAAQAKDVYAVYKLFWKGDTSPIHNGTAPVALELREQVHDDNIVPTYAALQSLVELVPDEENKVTILAEEAQEVALAGNTLVFRNEAPRETLDLLTSFDGKRSYEHLEETSSARENMRPHRVKRPRNAEPDSPQNLFPRAQEPNSSNSVAKAIPSLKLSLACPVLETAPKQQEQLQIATPPPVPEQAAEQPQAAGVPTLQRFRITIEREADTPETSEHQCKKDA